MTGKLALAMCNKPRSQFSDCRRFSGIHDSRREKLSTREFGPMWSYSRLLSPPITWCSHLPPTRCLSRLCMMTIRYFNHLFLLIHLPSPHTKSPREASSILYPAFRRILHFSQKKFTISLLGPPPLLSLHFYRWPHCFLGFQVLHGVPGIFLLFSFRPFMFSLLPYFSSFCFMGTG
jgi:hypothetical protein